MSKRPPNATETTPSGIVIDYYAPVGVDDEPQQRRYLVNQERFVNVTTATGIFEKHGLYGWIERETKAGRDWRDTRDSAGERGRAAHDLIVRWMAKVKDASLADLEDEHRNWGQAAAKWLLHRKPELLDAERMVASVEHGYAGRYDLMARIDGIPTRVDFKTVTSWAYKRKKGEPTDEKLPPYPENAMQLSAYELAARESGYGNADELLVVRLGPDGAYDETIVDYRPDRFLAALHAYHAKRDTERDLRVAA